MLKGALISLAIFFLVVLMFYSGAANKTYDFFQQALSQTDNLRASLAPTISLPALENQVQEEIIEEKTESVAGTAINPLEVKQPDDLKEKIAEPPLISKPTSVSENSEIPAAQNAEKETPEIKELKPEESKELELENSGKEAASLPAKVIINEILLASLSTTKDEFIELYNQGNQAIDISGWSVQKASAGGTIYKKNFEKSHVIPGRGYFLIVNAESSQGLRELADLAHSSFDLADNNTIFLVKNQEKIENPQDPDVIDKVGFGQPFSFEEKPTLNPEKSQSLERKNNQDTDNNWEDFIFQKEPTLKGQIFSLINLPVYSNNGGGGGGVIESDKEKPVAIAGSDQNVEINQPLTFDGSGSSDNIAILYYQWDVDNDGNRDLEGKTAVLTAGYPNSGVYLVTLKVIDTSGNSSQDTLMINASSPPKILISEVQTTGQTSKDEFIELYNPNNYEVDLAGFSLRKKTASGNESNLISSSSFSEKIPGLNYFLIVPQPNDDGTPNYQGTAIPDRHYSGKTYSIADDNTILLYSSQGNLIDKVGFGSAQDFGTSPAQNPAPNYSLARKWNSETENYYDADNDLSDFEIRTPSPKAKNQIKDIVPPDAIQDLLAGIGTSRGQVDLSWTTPNDNSNKIKEYQIRYSANLITEDIWNATSTIDVLANKPTPKAPGEEENMIVSGLTPGIVYYFAVKSLDEDNNVSLISNSASGQACFLADYLIINEVQIASATDQKDEFVELYNPADSDIDLTGWYVQRKTKGAGSYSSYAPNTLFSGKTIKAKDFFLIARANSSFAGLANATTTYPLTEDNTLVLKNPGREIVDKVGWGSASDFEGLAPSLGPQTSQSINRTILGSDIDDNSQDFQINNTPTPTKGSL